ncbi:aspartate/glutamate racemase family protein [Thermodesulfobacteriota bacterium]
MIGWRARIGSIQPSRGGETFSYEFYKMAPDGVVLLMAKTNIRELTESELERAFGEYEQAGKTLATEEVDFIVAGGTPVIALRGKGADKEIAERIQKATRIPALHNFTAVMAALRELKVKKVAVVTPYRDAVNLRHKRFLEENGFDVVKIKGLQIERNVEIAKTPPYAAYRLAKETFREAPGAEGIFISCGRWQTVSFIELLERDLKVPVVSNTLAAIWAAFSRTGVGEAKPGFGQLMRTL